MWRYYTLVIVGLTVARLPRKVGYLLARLAAEIAYVVDPALRNRVADNMRHVLGREVADAGLRRTVRGVMTNVARNYLDMTRIPRMRLSDIERCIEVHGWHHVEDAIARGRGIVFVTAHIGSFDMVAQVFAVRSIKLTIPVEPLEPPTLLRHVTELRTSHGLDFLPAQSGFLKILIQSLRRGEAVLLACDRDIAVDGLRVDFFGEEATLPTLAVRLAMRTGATVIPVFALCRGNAGYGVCFEPALSIVQSGDGALRTNMEQVTHVMEGYIRRYPEQWVVLSPVWAHA